MNNANNAAAKAAASKKKMMLAAALIVFFCCVCCCISSVVSGGGLFFASKKKDEPTASPSDESPSDESPSDESPSDESPPAASPPAVSKQYAVLPYETTPVFYEDNKMWSLSGLDVTCRQSKKYPNALSQFHLKRTVSGFGKTGVSKNNNIKYDYKCLAGVEKEHTISGFDSGGKHTNCDTHGDGNTVYLDRHHVDCGKSPILEFKGNRCMSTDKYRYKYRCGNHKSESCRDVSTNFNDEGGGKVVYLDRHDVKCKEGEEYISKFKLSRDGQGKYRYDYTCCKP